MLKHKPPPPPQKGNWGESVFWEQLDSIFKASSGTFEHKVTLTRVWAAVGSQRGVFNAANAFCWFHTNISEQKKVWKLALLCTKAVVSIHFPASQLVWISMRAERWELRQGGSVDTARSEAVMNGSLIPEMLHLAACGWHVGAAQRDGRAENPDKAAPPSDRQGVFELSPGEGRRKKFWEAELRVNSICWKTTTATSALPHQGALLKCKACAASAPDKETLTD